MIEESIDSEMKSRGVSLEEANETSESAVRKRVAKRMKARQELATHIANRTEICTTQIIVVINIK